MASLELLVSFASGLRDHHKRDGNAKRVMAVRQMRRLVWLYGRYGASGCLHEWCTQSRADAYTSYREKRDVVNSQLQSRAAARSEAFLTLGCWWHDHPLAQA